LEIDLRMMSLMWWRRVKRSVRLACVLACLAVPGLALASEYHGQVVFNGLPVPGVAVTATQGSKTFTAISDENGNYSFPDLPDGAWKIELTMTGFTTVDQDVTVASDTPAIKWELKMLPLDAMIAQAKTVKVAPVVVAAAEAPKVPAKGDAAKPAQAGDAGAPKPPDEPKESSDGFLVNGSVNNAATSQFTLAPAFGNTRSGSKGLYTGGLSLILDNSATDAKSYSLGGFDTAKPSYNRVTAAISFGGPIRIPHLVRRGPNFFVGYQWTRNANAVTEDGLMPTAAQRCIGVTCPVTISPQAMALLAYYPLPNLAGNSMYNYQIPIVSNMHQDSIQTRLDKGIGRRDYLYGGVASQDTRSDNSNLFGFRDVTDALGINANINWNHRMNHNIYTNTGYRFSRSRITVIPYFENRKNVSGDAGIIASGQVPGIIGNDQDPANWGPPSLTFSSGITGLSDDDSSFTRYRSDLFSESVSYYRGRHNVTFGGDFRRQDSNYFNQENPRGSFTFNGAVTGISDFADFLQGNPETSAVAYGNADKYLRKSAYDAFATDDWRIRPELTINVGLRWEYGAPMTELKNRLVNLDIAPGFSNAQAVLASSPKGPLTGQNYPTTLVRPDHLGIEPRLAVSWRPIPGSSVVVRGGYGVYDDTSVYQGTALNLAQQEPLSTSLNVKYDPATCPLTLANGFIQCAGITADTFAIDPNFRVGYAQVWQLAVQRDLPAALQMTATYLGTKGTRGMQEFYPNSYAPGAANPCPTCPSGFVYRTSNGDSTREAGSLQLRRRLRSGFTATMQYTYSKSIDNDSALGGQGPIAAGATSQTSGGISIAQNWLNLRGERGLSTFDQRHLLNATFQYTSGMGIGGGTLMSGWRGRAIKEWTVTGTIVAGSGLPETPIFLATLSGTGATGLLRPDRTSAPLYAGSGGHFLNAAAFAAPQLGQFGNAGRDSITGPGVFTFNASVSRTFRVTKKYNLDVRVDSTNPLNHPVYTNYYTTINPSTGTGLTPQQNSPLFGEPASVNPMRSLQTTARLRF
jgi:hypothetical protein